MIKKPITKKMSSSVEEKTATAAIGSANTNSNVAMKVESSNLNTKTTNTGYHPYKKKLPLPKTSQPNCKKPGNHNIKGFGVIDQNKLQQSCDGMMVLPIKIKSYQSFEITAAEYSLCKKIGLESFMMDKKGNHTPCFVVKTTNAFAVIVKSSDSYYCHWAMARCDLVKKVKGTDNLVYVDIQIHDELGEQTARVPRKVFAEGKLNALTKYDLAVIGNPELESAVAIYFTQLLDEIPMEDAAQVIGVVKDRKTKELIFNGYGEHGEFKVANQYGDYKGYLKHFNPLLEQSKPLQYLLSATMAAPVLTLLQQKFNKNVHSYIINAVGESSTGKTISSRVCASAWTNPTDEIIFSAMHCTPNAALKNLSGRFGVPTFLDEATASGIKASEYAYTVYEGVEKERLNSDCSMKASGKWSTIVCMSSEEHFHANDKNQNGGLAVRIHSVDDQKWTNNAKHANALDSFISKNYGVIGAHFTNTLFKWLSDPKYDLGAKYDAACDTMKQLCADSKFGFTDRLCGIYGLTYMTAEILKKLGLAVDVDAVAQIMVGHHKMVSEDQDLGLNAFRAILSYLARENDKVTKGIRKFYNDRQELTKVAIERSLMTVLLGREGFQDVKVAAKALDKAGYLIRQGEGKGLISKLTINKVLCECYQIDMSSTMGSPDSIAARILEKAKGVVLYDDTAESEAEEIFEDDADVLSAEAETDENFWDEDADTDAEESGNDAETMDEETESEEFDWNAEDDESEAEEDFEDDAGAFGDDAEPEAEFDFSAFQVEGVDEADADDTESDEDDWTVEEESDTEQESEGDWAEEEDADDDEYIESSGIDWDEIPIHSYDDAYEEDDDDDDDEYDE